LSSRPTFLTQTKLVTVSFTFRPSGKEKRLTTRSGLELGADDIEILDNGVPRPLALLERTGSPEATLPTDVILLFDCTRNFRSHVGAEAVDFRFLDELENVGVSIYGFGDSLYRLIRPSRDKTQLALAMAYLPHIPNVGMTDLNPIVKTIQAAVALPDSRPRMLIIYSGAVAMACHMPRNDYAEAVRLARQCDIALYPVAVQSQIPAVRSAAVSGHDAIQNPVPASRGYLAVNEFLRIGSPTGGKAFFRFTTPKAVLEDVFKFVRSQTASEYTAGYYLAGFSDTGAVSHKIEVRLKRNLGELTGGVRETKF
jgi:hypothetical protein